MVSKVRLHCVPNIEAIEEQCQVFSRNIHTAVKCYMFLNNSIIEDTVWKNPNFKRWI